MKGARQRIEGKSNMYICMYVFMCMCVCSTFNLKDSNLRLEFQKMFLIFYFMCMGIFLHAQICPPHACLVPWTP